MCYGSTNKMLYYNNILITNLEISNNITAICPYAFLYCGSLKSVTIANDVTYVGDRAFAGCGSLTNVNIGDSVKIIRWGAFYDCENLKNVIIGNGVTYLNEAIFYSCSSLESIVLNSKITGIDDYVFYHCSNLKTVYYTGTAIEWNKIKIDGYNNDLTDTKRYYYIENEADVPTDGGNYWHYVNGVPTAWEN